jgi:hypothetical protein
LLRVDLRTTPERETLISLTGDFTDQYIPCVDSALAQARAAGGPIVLNLRQVMLVDRGAMCYLNALRGKDVDMVECPPYVLRWMDQERGHCH